MQHANSMMGSVSNPSYMMESLKQNMFTMMMVQNMGQNGGRSNNQSGFFSMIYAFLATNLIDYLFRYLPVAVGFVQKRYLDKIINMKHELANSTVDITDNKIKKKTASITITVSVYNPDNIFGQAILDYITNHSNTTHVSYIREHFMLNQKDVINLEDDIFAKMTESTDMNAFHDSSTGNSQGNNNSGSTGGIVQIIEIYSFVKSNTELREYLDKIKQRYMVNVKNKLGNKRYFFNLHPIPAPIDINKTKDYSRLPPNLVFTMKQFQTNRKFSNLFGEDISLIRSRVNFFTSNKKWYDEKGIPYTLGLLLSGAPGTGKTSTIKCLANETRRHICNINFNNDITKRQLENLFFNEDITIMNQNTMQTETYCIPLDQRIYVFEDIDCQSEIIRERGSAVPTQKSELETCDPLMEDKHKIDLSFLLNLLDGVLENPGRIIIMTSNYPENLDSALIRPGRIDIIAKFRNCTNTTIIKMMEFFYNIKLDIIERKEIEALITEIITPAELSKIMFENFSDYQKTMQVLKELSNNHSNTVSMRCEKHTPIASDIDDTSSVLSNLDSETLSIEIHNESNETKESNTNPDEKSPDELMKMTDDELFEYIKDFTRPQYKKELKETFLLISWHDNEKILNFTKEFNIDTQKLIQKKLDEILDEFIFNTDMYKYYAIQRYKIEKIEKKFYCVMENYQKMMDYSWKIYKKPFNTIITKIRNRLQNFIFDNCKQIYNGSINKDMIEYGTLDSSVRLTSEGNGFSTEFCNYNDEFKPINTPDRFLE